MARRGASRNTSPVTISSISDGDQSAVPLGTFASPPDDPLAGIFRSGDFAPFTAMSTRPANRVLGCRCIATRWSTDRHPARAAYGREDVLLRISASSKPRNPSRTRQHVREVVGVVALVACSSEHDAVTASGSGATLAGSAGWVPPAAPAALRENDVQVHLRPAASRCP